MDLSTLRITGGGTLIHILCQDRGKFVASVKTWAKQSKEEYKLSRVVLETKGKSSAQVLEYLLCSKCDINARDGRGWTPLDVASSRKNSQSKQDELDWIECLIKSGASPTEGFVTCVLESSIRDINVRSRRSFTDSFRSSQFNPEKRPIDLVGSLHERDRILFIEILISKLNQLRFSPSAQGKVDTASIIINLIGTVVKLLADVPTLDKTLLMFVQTLCQSFEDEIHFEAKSVNANESHKALRPKLLEITRGLLGGDDDDGVNYRDDTDGETCLHIVAREGLAEYVCLLLGHPKVKVNTVDKEGNTALSACLKAMLKGEIWRTTRLPQFLKVVHCLVARVEFDYSVADKEDAIPLVRCVKLIGAVNPFYKDASYYRTVLERTCKDIHISVTEDYGVVLLLARENEYKTLERILREKTAEGQLRRPTDQGRTALHVAAHEGNVESVKVLVQHDAGLCNMRDENGNTPLFYLVRNCPSRAVTNFLDSPDWDFTQTNNLGETVMDYYKASTNSKQSQSVTDLLRKKIKEADRVKKKPPGRIKRDRNMEKSRFLPKSVIDRQHKTLRRPPHRYYLSKKRPLHDVLADMDQLRQAFKEICTHSGNAIDKKHCDKTALMWCVVNELPDEVDFLCKTYQGTVDFSQQGEQGKTALHLAVKSHSMDCTKVLLRHMSGKCVNQQDNKGNTALFNICTEFPPECIEDFIGQDIKWDYTLRNNARHTVLDHYRYMATRPSRGMKSFTKDETIEKALEHYCSIAFRSGSVVKWEHIQELAQKIASVFTNERSFYIQMRDEGIPIAEDKIKELCGMDPSTALQELLAYLSRKEPHSAPTLLRVLRNSGMEREAEMVESRGSDRLMPSNSPQNTPFFHSNVNSERGSPVTAPSSFRLRTEPAGMEAQTAIPASPLTIPVSNVWQTQPGHQPIEHSNVSEGLFLDSSGASLTGRSLPSKASVGDDDDDETNRKFTYNTTL